MKTRLAMVVTIAFTLGVSVLLFGSKMDDKIESSFRNSYVAKTYLKDDSVQIEAKDGIVTLTGAVADDSHKSLAGETAAGLPAVTRVDNRLEVRNHYADHADVASNDWVTAKVKATLLFHSKVSAGTEVTVKDGVVTLDGTADSLNQKNLTADYARGVDGVTDVKNHMTISTAPSDTTKNKDKAMEEIDDASITAQIKMALLFDRSTSSLKTTVKTTNGVVMLTGKATTNTERDHVTNVVSDIKGVKSVKNRMTL
jgi:hyperosmotically inducible protein